MTMLPARHGLRDGPQCGVGGCLRCQVRALIALRPGSSEACPLQSDNDDAAGLAGRPFAQWGLAPVSALGWLCGMVETGTELIILSAARRLTTSCWRTLLGASM
jgi:hypothetical protein